MLSMMNIKKRTCVPIVVVVMGLLTAPSQAAARKGGPAAEVATPAKARELRDKGIVALNLGRYEDAVVLLEEAYELSRETSILFDLVQAHRLNGNPERALVLCASFLRTRPNLTSRNREEIEKTVAELGIIVEQIRLEGKGARPVRAASTKTAAKEAEPAVKSAVIEPRAAAKVEPVAATDSEAEEEAAQEKQAKREGEEEAKPPLPPSAARADDVAKVDEQARAAALVKSEPAPVEEQPRKSWLRSPWVWTAAGVVAAGIVGSVVVYQSTKDPGAPRTSWGSQKVF